MLHCYVTNFFFLITEWKRFWGWDMICITMNTFHWSFSSELQNNYFVQISLWMRRQVISLLVWFVFVSQSSIELQRNEKENFNFWSIGNVGRLFFHKPKCVGGPHQTTALLLLSDAVLKIPMKFMLSIAS